MQSHLFSQTVRLFHVLTDPQEFEKRIQKERNEMLYRDHMREQDWLIQMREMEEQNVQKMSEYDLRLRLLEKSILMAESEKEISIQSLLESQEVTLKEMNDECEKKVGICSVKLKLCCSNLPIWLWSGDQLVHMRIF